LSVQTDESSGEAEVPGGALRPLHPNQIWVLRVRTLIFILVLLGAALAADAGPLRESELAAGLVPGLVALLGLAATIALPRRRYRAWGYREDEEEIHIRHGLVVRIRTIVPFGRVQHIDLAQGPLERPFGLFTLILHTAGTRGSSVRLPGLAQGEAEAMRDRIRARIRQDLV